MTLRRRKGHQLRKSISLLCILAALLFSAVVLGCGSKTPEQKTREEVQAVTKVQDDAQVYYQKLTKESGKDAAVQETVDWLKRQDGIEEAGIGSGCVWYKLKNGVTGLIQTDSMITE